MTALDPRQAKRKEIRAMCEGFLAAMGKPGFIVFGWKDGGSDDDFVQWVQASKDLPDRTIDDCLIAALSKPNNDT